MTDTDKANKFMYGLTNTAEAVIDTANFVTRHTNNLDLSVEDLRAKRYDLFDSLINEVIDAYITRVFNPDEASDVLMDFVGGFDIEDLAELGERIRNNGYKGLGQMVIMAMSDIYAEERQAGVYNPYNELIFFSDPYWATQEKFPYLPIELMIEALLGLEKYNAEIKKNPYADDYLNKIAADLISVYKSSIAELYIGTFNGMLTTMSYTATGYEQLQYTNMIIQQDLRHQFAYYDSVTGNRAPATDMDTEAALMTSVNAAGGAVSYETYYRTMSQTDYQKFLKTGKIPATGETFISPSQAFSSGYDGVLVEFKVNAGTTSSLESIGVRDASNLTGTQYPNMPGVQSGWSSSNAYFKGEGSGLINIGLGRGNALDIFNNNIVDYKILGK